MFSLRDMYCIHHMFEALEHGLSYTAKEGESSKEIMKGKATKE